MTDSPHIFIYNSLTRKKEELVALRPPRLNIYSCGVTVYDHCHIGHARSLYTFDLMVRYLRFRGFKVKFVRNITDIDDKVIRRAKELGIGWRVLAKNYIESYRQDLESLGIKKADAEPRATENIAEMVKYIASLIEKGYAYVRPSGVYFSVRKFKSYGRLSGQGIDQMLSGVRIEPDENKDDPLDFALWKKSGPGEPFWPSPWGGGRPGWHIECTVMSRKFLKTDTLDIHAGGRDLIFPHHENEISQAEALTAKPFSRYWVHHGLLSIEGQKMSKSYGNFIAIRDFIKQYRDPNALKLFFLSVHYAHPIDYTVEKIEEARKQKESFDAFFDKVNNSCPLPGRAIPQLSLKDKARIDEFGAKFQQAMDDDFNTPQALASLFELMDFASAREACYKYARARLKVYFDILGLKAKPKVSLPRRILKLNRERNLAKKNNDFKSADGIREEIEKAGFIAVDTGNAVSFIEISPRGHIGGKED